MSVIAVFGIASLAAWLYLLLGHGRFWMVQQLAGATRNARAKAANVAVVIPARNEADVIGRAIASLLRQKAVQLHIFVVDDGSIDGTADAARAAAASQPERTTVIAGRPLAPGWTGKLWALQQGVDAARQFAPDFLLFTDADIEHAPDNVATLVGVAQTRAYDLTSFMVTLHCETVAEKLLIPALVFFFFMLYPPRWVRDAKRRGAGAAGGCMLVRPAALDRIGGIATIRHEIIDDCALARAVKRSGGRVWLGATEATRSLRSYSSFGEIHGMIARSAFNQLRHSAWLLLGTGLGMLLLFVVPALLIVSGSLRLLILGALSYATMTIAYAPMVRFYKLSLAWAPSLPFAGVFYAAATVDSALKYWSGKGGEWKGRAQDVKAGLGARG